MCMGYNRAFTYTESVADLLLLAAHIPTAQVRNLVQRAGLYRTPVTDTP
jgi:hypothetical protein